MEILDRPLVLFDGGCGFCARAVGVMTGRMIRADVVAEPLQRADLPAVGLTVDKCLETLHVVDESVVFTGSDAIACILRAGRSPWPLAGRLLTLPGVRQVAGAAYALVARNRHRLPGGTTTCGL